MERDLYIQRKKEFIDKIKELKTLPIVWKHHFSDGEDMRLWFNKIFRSNKFNDFIKEIENILKNYNIKILTDKEKEEEFLNYIKVNNQIPLYGEIYFKDNDEMHSWYTSYIAKNKHFETIVHNNLKEYLDLDLAYIWPRVKKEFIYNIKKIRRIPKHREYFTQDGIDIRTIYDKLESFDPEFTEKLLLYLAKQKENSIPDEIKINELLSCIKTLGYIPYLQEYRFSDGTDMFTWYNRKQKEIPGLKEKVNLSLKKPSPKRNVNIYLIPNFKNTGGKFYTVCSNTGDILDLSNINSFEEAKLLDENIVKRGGVILKQNEEISTVNFVKGRKK